MGTSWSWCWPSKASKRSRPGVCWWKLAPRMSRAIQARPEQFSGNLTHVMGAPQGAGPAAEAAGPLAERIQPGMVVLGADAEVIGRVKQVGAEDFLVDRELQTDVYVPFATVRTRPWSGQ